MTDKARKIAKSPTTTKARKIAKSPTTTKAQKIPKLPKMLDRKFYKTGQTRGADDDEIYRNRVLRSGTVLIPLSHWDLCKIPSDGTTTYDSGYIVLVSPAWYQSQANPQAKLASGGLTLGRNALIFYERRTDWLSLPPASNGWVPATSRTAPLGGHYVARISANTSVGTGGRISAGFNTTAIKGAGIRVYEYASGETIKRCRVQLEAILWKCRDANTVLAEMGMSSEDIEIRSKYITDLALTGGLLDLEKLKKQRILNADGFACCPLCLKELSALGFGSLMTQASGREVSDLTVTEISLFHVKELRTGELGHTPYNLGWGHHHCNVVAKDSGIEKTLSWIVEILERNKAAGYEF